MPMVVRIIVYPIFAVGSFLIFCAFLFPFDSIRTRIETEAEKGLGGQYEVQISKMSLAPLTGLALKQVTVKEKSGSRMTVLKVDGAEVHFELLPLIWGAVRLGFDLESAESRVKGRFAQSGPQLNVQVDIEDLNVAQFPMLEAKWGLALESKIDGKVDVEIYPASPLKNNGSIQLAVDKLAMKKSDIKGLFPLPAMTFAAPQGKSTVDIVMNRGSVEVRSLNLGGGDFTANLGGKVYLAQRVDNFRFNIRGKLGVSEKLIKELPILMILEKQKGTDGLYPITVTGQVRQPNIRIGDFKIPL